MDGKRQTGLAKDQESEVFAHTPTGMPARSVFCLILTEV